MGAAFKGCKKIKTIVIGENTLGYGTKPTAGRVYASPIFSNYPYYKLYIKRQLPPDGIGVWFNGETRISYLGIPKGSKKAYLDAGWDYSHFEVIEEVDFDKLGY